MIKWESHDREAAAVGSRPIPEPIRHDDREIVLVLEDNGIPVTRPAPGVNMEEPDDCPLYACAVLAPDIASSRTKAIVTTAASRMASRFGRRSSSRW